MKIKFVVLCNQQDLLFRIQYDNLMAFLRTDAITRLCSCGPIKFVLELLASVKIE